jgi:hypothetical protein
MYTSINSAFKSKIREIPRWQLERGSRKCASYSEILERPGDTPCRQNHQEEAKL